MKYTHGTHRLVPPTVTLKRVRPYWDSIGLTRCFDITGLDCIGIPVFTSVRPRAAILQVSSGKGISLENAECSAVMEAIELYHAENPNQSQILWSSEKSLEHEAQAKSGNYPISPHKLMADALPHYSAKIKQPWIIAEELISKSSALLPAGSTYFIQPSFCRTNTNGLSSGNSINEATLHALYELIERDSCSRLVLNGRVRLNTYGRVVSLDSIEDSNVCELAYKIQSANCKLKLVHVPSSTQVHTFMAFILDGNPLHVLSEVHFGSGCHGDMGVAACRAISEAAQSRLIFIHGSREDILPKIQQASPRSPNSPVYRIVNNLNPSITWQDLVDKTEPIANTIDSIFHNLLTDLAKIGHNKIYRHVLPSVVPGVFVSKVHIPTMQFNAKIL